MKSLSVTAAHLFLSTLAGLGLWYLTEAEAEACGCFARPDPTVPLVQAGERIVFALENGEVTAHIQIQYDGAPEEFGWLLPLPSVPTMELGADELFTRIIGATQPRYRLLTEEEGSCMFPPPPPPPPPPPSAPGNGGPLVGRDTVGPYETATLRADSKQDMLDWLAENQFFVPAGTDEVVDPYIRPGAYFLAVKLRSGQSTGDLQPVVVKYQSELPMIPIVLTSVAADPDMPVLVWVLGDDRAIPRNFHHTEINDALIDWFDNGSNYLDVVRQAIDEADGHHSFITEYAGPSDILLGALDYEGRFGTVAELSQITDPIAYMQYLVDKGFLFDGQLFAILQRHLPVPPELIERGYSPADYYSTFGDLFGQYQTEFPDEAELIYANFDPAMLTAEINERIVEPTLAAGRLFRDNPYMTRLFTTLSPDEMTKDPVFSFNPDLPDVSNVHFARRIWECTNAKWPDPIPSRVVTEQGWVLRLPEGDQPYDWPSVNMPFSRRIETLREEGAPEVVTDNAAAIEAAIEAHRDPDRPADPDGVIDDGGCAVTASQGMHGRAGLAVLTVLGMLAMVRLRRRGRGRRA